MVLPDLYIAQDQTFPAMDKLLKSMWLGFFICPMGTIILHLSESDCHDGVS